MFGLADATPLREGQWRILPHEELNRVHAHFFIKVRKLKGEEFESGTLISFQRCFDRYLRQHVPLGILLSQIKYPRNSPVRK